MGAEGVKAELTYRLRKILCWALKGAALLIGAAGAILFLAAGVWGFVINLAIVNAAAGFWGVVIGILILPVTFLAAPWYALVAWGNLLPVAVVYGGALLFAVCCGAYAGIDMIATWVSPSLLRTGEFDYHPRKS